MAHYAKLDENNIVIDINVISDEKETSLGGEGGTVAWLIERYGGVDWKKTSYNTSAGVHTGGGVPFRKNYAGLDAIYDSDLDAFRYPQPFNSWSLNLDTCRWEAPITHPDAAEGTHYDWNEDLLIWELITE